MSLVMDAMVHLTHLYWWQWGKIIGLFLPVLFLGLAVEHPLLWAVAAHFLVDFTFQSGQTAAGKKGGQGGVLAYHAFISGGYAGFIIGGLAGLAVSVVIHFLVDWTDKFGLDEPTGPALDQAVHILTLVMIWWLL